jgi:hypothetical protein
MFLRVFSACLLACVAIPGTALALPLEQSWSDTGLIVGDDDWSGVAGIVGHRGDELVATTGADPQTVLADGAATPLDVIANASNPSALFTGGVAELELADPAVALQPSGTADAPHLVLTFETTGFGAIKVSYRLRDLDGSDDDAVQPVALQYRIGTTGDYANVPAAFVADATSGPLLAELETAVEVELPAGAGGQPVVQVRILTANANGSDEWVGVDDIAVRGTSETPPPPPIDTTPPALGVSTQAGLCLGRALRRGVPVEVTLDEQATVRLDLRLRPRLARRLRLPVAVGDATVALESGTHEVAVRFDRRARRKLARLRRFTLTVRASAEDEAGNATSAGTALVLRR